MTERIPEDEQSNYEIFRECVSVPVLKALAIPAEKPKKKAKGKKKGNRVLGQKRISVGGNADLEVGPSTGSEEQQLVLDKGVKEDNKEKLGGSNDAEDLGDFIEYLSNVIFTSLPPPLRRMTPSAFNSTPALQNSYTLPLSSDTATRLIVTISPTAVSTLESYLLLPSPSTPIDLSAFFYPILTSYITETITAPPVPIWSSTRTSACELCQREWIPLTYHHLIPRSTHAKVLKRGWHAEEKLGSVAWLCRACHSFVHRVASNEELARHWYTVELLEAREDVEKWVSWVGRVRWKAR